MFFSRIALIVFVSAAVLLCSSRALANFSVVRVASGLEEPVYVTAPPGDTSRLFIVEANSGGSTSGPQIARIKILNLEGPAAGTINPIPFLTISGIPQVEDQGLFCMAFHPNYASNGFFYVNYAFGGAGGQSRIERYKVSADPNVADPLSAVVILTFHKPFLNHNGDWLGFSPTDLQQSKYYLYHTTGDGGSNYDPNRLAQDLSKRNGKVLRIDVGADGLADDFPSNNSENYAVPPDNPFVSRVGADPIIWALGFRNPWRASFDRLTGDLYIGNVGSEKAEEVDFQPFNSPGGQNHGWSRYEGTSNGPNSSFPLAPQTTNVFPMYASAFSASSGFTTTPRRSITGGYVYRGSVPELREQYIFADFLGTYNFNNGSGAAQIFSIQYDGSSPANFNGNNIVNGQVLNRTQAFQPDVGAINFVSSFGEDANGELYIVDMGNLGTPDGQGRGEIFKIVCSDCAPNPVRNWDLYN